MVLCFYLANNNRQAGRDKAKPFPAFFVLSPDIPTIDKSEVLLHVIRVCG